MSKTTSNTSEEIRSSVSSIYSAFLNKRKMDYEEKEAKKKEEKKIRELEKEEKDLKDDGTKMTKSEKRAAELDNWKEVIIGLTGDDLEYTNKKKEKKKYTKWIGDENDNIVLTPKPKKVKKKNYNKEFEPELNMLKAIVSDQNKFTTDLQRRFQNAAGPATKDAMPLNKTMVELASAINASRTNSLGLLREIGNIKKTIADLYMKQKKLDSDLGAGSGSGFNTTDIGLMGSSIASAMFEDGNILSSQSNTPITNNAMPYSAPQQAPVTSNNVESPLQPTAVNSPMVPSSPQIEIQEFDPNSWGGPELSPDNSVPFENIPHDFVVEWHKAENIARMKAIRKDNGEELVGCPVPSVNPKTMKFSEKDGVVKGQFDEIYKLEVV